MPWYTDMLAPTYAEYLNGNNKTPEVDFFAMTEGRSFIGRHLRPSKSVQYEKLIARIYDGMNRLSEHRGATRCESSNELRHRDETVSDERRIDYFLARFHNVWQPSVHSCSARTTTIENPLLAAPHQVWSVSRGKINLGRADKTGQTKNLVMLRTIVFRRGRSEDGNTKLIAVQLLVTLGYEWGANRRILIIQ
jgi:hypothetical protein